MKTLAGIVTYHPEIERLRENVCAASTQVDQVVIFINGEESAEATKTAVEGLDSVVLLHNKRNDGIALALARIMEYAAANSFDWVLSIDQDSVCREGLVDQYKTFTGLPNVGALTCCITDRNFTQDFGFDSGEKYHRIDKCITAGTFMSVDAYQHCDGYDISMFIDGVDWDICYNLRRHGYLIYRINFDGILQEVGHGKDVSLLGKKYVAYGESPLRNYYGARNDIYLANKYPEFLSMGRTLLREVRAEIIVLLFETQKRAKLWNRWRGIKAGFSMAAK